MIPIGVLAVDPGMRGTGWSVFTKGVPVATGAVNTANRKDMKAHEDFARRAQIIALHLARVVDAFQPDVVVAEMPYGPGGSFVATWSMAMVSGVVATLVGIRNLQAVWVTPLQVKMATAGKRDAEKSEVEAAVLARFPGVNLPSRLYEREHAADSLGAFMAAEKYVWGNGGGAKTE